MALPPHSKVALLICDPTKEEFIDSYGTITSLFTNLYTRFLISITNPTADASTLIKAFLPEVIQSFRVDAFSAIERQYPTDVDQYDSIIVSGSAHSVNDHDGWITQLAEFLNTTATEHPKVKLIGICFGHQIISHAVFGNPVRGNHKGWEIGPYKVTLNDTGKKLFTDVESLNIEMFHHDAVFTKDQHAAFRKLYEAKPYHKHRPENTFHIWGSSEKTANQGIVALNKDAEESGMFDTDDIHIFTCQGHPELTQGMTSYLVDLFENEIGKDSVKEARTLIADFKGTLDWYKLTMFMWALSTRHTLALGFPIFTIFTPHGVKNPADEVIKDIEKTFKLFGNLLPIESLGGMSKKEKPKEESLFVLVV
ncbi:class I glutamine amidotransferase-like protein [Leucogyrophana mollusca]|uniref:Class I glutamine amidotransferase-like protein n=1 Tax=Leucogyrophana mollusca TaxID=85980 RepID=A0ACB8B9M2_9AGAM|nr:class I glutamine amidotransferase-like protein [Leucogyrophana mollusca]